MFLEITSFGCPKKQIPIVSWPKKWCFSGTRKINCVESLQISPEIFSFCRYLRNILRHTPKQMSIRAITMSVFPEIGVPPNHPF